MRVNQGGSPLQGNEAAGAKQSGKSAATQESKRPDRASTAEVEKNPTRGANAEISSKSKDFAKAKSIASGAPDVREDKVADLKRRIAEGSYKVDTDAVADRMVDDHLKMSGI